MWLPQLAQCVGRSVGESLGISHLHGEILCSLARATVHGHLEQCNAPSLTFYHSHQLDMHAARLRRAVRAARGHTSPESSDDKVSNWQADDGSDFSSIDSAPQSPITPKQNPHDVRSIHSPLGFSSRASDAAAVPLWPGQQTKSAAEDWRSGAVMSADLGSSAYNGTTRPVITPIKSSRTPQGAHGTPPRHSASGTRLPGLGPARASSAPAVPAAAGAAMGSMASPKVLERAQTASPLRTAEAQSELDAMRSDLKLQLQRMKASLSLGIRHQQRQLALMGSDDAIAAAHASARACAESHQSNS